MVTITGTDLLRKDGLQGVMFRTGMGSSIGVCTFTRILHHHVKTNYKYY
jgi:hypothetical protein